MTASGKRMFLVDGSAMFYRAYFAFIRNPLINSKGENTSATFGFVNSLLKVIKDEDPDYFAVVFDTKEPTFRHKEYAEYKSTRAKMPDDLVAQLPRIRAAVEVLNIPSYEMVGYEADDVIGTVAVKAAKEGFDVWCVTGDKDYFQLVNNHIKIYNPKRGSEPPEIMGPKEVEAKFGVPPALVIDKLALMGDSSDNVPGVPGVGPKTADSLLKEFGTLDAVLENCDKIKAKGVRQKVSDNIDQAKLSKRLVTIHTEVPVEFDWHEMKRGPINYDATRELFLELEFNTLLRELLPKDEAAKIEEKKKEETFDYKTVDSLAALKKLVTKLSKAKELAIDTETTSLNPLEADLVGVSLTDHAKAAWYLPLGHTGEGEVNLPFDESITLIKKLFENKDVQKFGQNIKYDLHVLRRYDIDVNPIGFDTMLASYVINPTQRQHSLDFLSLQHFKFTKQPIKELIGSGKSQKSFATVPVSKATSYSCEDADFTFRLRGEMAPVIEDTQMQNLYYHIELPLIKVLASMEETGIRVDDKYLKKLSGEMEKKLDKVKEKIYKIAGGQFNINSTQQLAHILFEKLGLPTKGKTAKKTGYSTDVSVLEELAKIHEFPALVLEFRQLTKLKNTYIDAIPKLISPTTGRVHTSFNQTIAATGRLSSTDPNLQNIPIRTDEGRQIRKAFVPRDHDYILLAADYSQIELRVLAHYTQDKGLIDAFKHAEDIHARTASEVFGVKLDEVTPQMRRTAKTANFAVIYGVTPYGLSQQTEMSVDEAKKFIDTYLERYAGIKEYIESTKQFARDKGYVTTMYNRRRYIPEINDRNHNVRSFAERTAINSPIQGTAADIIKLAMIKIDRQLHKMKSRMVLQVHDELVFDVYKKELEEVREIVRTGMEKAVKLHVPLVADIGVGDNWLECK